MVETWSEGLFSSKCWFCETIPQPKSSSPAKVGSCKAPEGPFSTNSWFCEAFFSANMWSINQISAEQWSGRPLADQVLVDAEEVRSAQGAGLACETSACSSSLHMTKGRTHTRMSWPSWSTNGLCHKQQSDPILLCGIVAGWRAFHVMLVYRVLLYGGRFPCDGLPPNCGKSNPKSVTGPIGDGGCIGNDDGATRGRCPSAQMAACPKIALCCFCNTAAQKRAFP